MIFKIIIFCRLNQKAANMANEETDNKTSEIQKGEPNDSKTHPVFEIIKTSDSENVVDDVRNYFEVNGVSVEIMDNTGMTPLMQACWKGNLELAKFLINQVIYDVPNFCYKIYEIILGSCYFEIN